MFYRLRGKLIATLFLPTVIVCIALAESSLTMSYIQKPVFLALSSVEAALFTMWRLSIRSRKVCTLWVCGVIADILAGAMAYGITGVLHLLAISSVLAALTTMGFCAAGIGTRQVSKG